MDVGTMGIGITQCSSDGILSSKFRDPSTLSFEQLNDPDFALKELESLNKGKLAITCSKCHHCR
jgi:hypothetical protein